MTSNVVWIVMADAGSHSEREEWVYFATLDKEAAEKTLAQLDKEIEAAVVRNREWHERSRAFLDSSTLSGLEKSKAWMEWKKVDPPPSWIENGAEGCWLLSVPLGQVGRWDQST